MTNAEMNRKPNVARQLSNPLGSAALRGMVLALAAAALACGDGSDAPSQAGPTDDFGAGSAGAGGGPAANAIGGADDSAAGAGGADVGSAAGGAETAGGETTGGSGDADPGGSADVPHTFTCNPIGDGATTVGVNGKTRSYSVKLPADTSKMALLFVWHGFMQDPNTFANEIVFDTESRNWVPFDPNAFPMPLMIVTPTSTNLLPLAPPAGLDWDISGGATDFPFFEGMLECINQQFNIDESRIYSFGFSAGAVFTNLLSAEYPHLFAATISESGAWFNDMAQWSDVSIPIVTWTWPDFDPADGGNVLLTHGGPEDFATVISLESANQKALPFLHGNGRTVTECSHTFGHTPDPDLTQDMYYDYMWRHQLGGPPLSGLPPEFPTQADPVGSTHCNFHPAP